MNGVIRVKKRDEHPFVMLERKTLQNASVSLKARGLWAVCMSYPDDWEFNLSHLANHVSEHDGKTAVRSALQELEVARLAKLHRLRKDDGTFGGTQWVIYENSSLHPDAADAQDDSHRDAGFPDVGVSPMSDNPKAVYPDVGEIAPNIEDNKDNIDDRERGPARAKQEARQDDEGEPVSAHGGPSMTRCLEIGRQVMLPETEVRAFWHHYEARGWEVRGSPIREPRSLMQRWKQNMHKFKGHSNGKPNATKRTAAEQFEATERLKEQLYGSGRGA
jgi:hypothetical protein